MLKTGKYVRSNGNKHGGVTIPDIVIETEKFKSVMDCAGAIKMYFVLAGNIVRSEMRSRIYRFVYEKFYVKSGLLPAYFTDDALASKLGYKTRSAVSKARTALVKAGFVKTVKFELDGRTHDCYILGTRGPYGRPNDESILAFDECLRHDRDLKLERVM